jgi:hypothetical protein
LNLREKIKERLDALQKMMECQEHLSNPEAVTEKLESVSKFWSVLSEEDREWTAAARMALNSQMKWN